MKPGIRFKGGQNEKTESKRPQDKDLVEGHRIIRSDVSSVATLSGRGAPKIDLIVDRLAGRR